MCSPLFIFIFSNSLGGSNSHQQESLIGFLLRSNSLDLIIDVAVELWKAFVGS